MNKLFEKHGTDIQFFFVYCAEAHASDGPKPNHIDVKAPVTNDERRELAQKFVKDFEMDIPVLLDEIDDKVSTAYAALPDRLYLIGKDGKIAFAGDKGPRGFKPEQLAESIAKLVSDSTKSE